MDFEAVFEHAAQILSYKPERLRKSARVSQANKLNRDMLIFLMWQSGQLTSRQIRCEAHNNIFKGFSFIIPAKDGIFDQHQVSNIQHRFACPPVYVSHRFVGLSRSFAMQLLTPGQLHQPDIVKHHIAKISALVLKDQSDTQLCLYVYFARDAFDHLFGAQDDFIFENSPHPKGDGKGPLQRIPHNVKLKAVGTGFQEQFLFLCQHTPIFKTRIHVNIKWNPPSYAGMNVHG